MALLGLPDAQAGVGSTRAFPDDPGRRHLPGDIQVLIASTAARVSRTVVAQGLSQRVASLGHLILLMGLPNPMANDSGVVWSRFEATDVSAAVVDRGS